MRNLSVWWSTRKPRHLSTPAALLILFVCVPVVFYPIVALQSYLYAREHTHKWHEASLLSAEKQYYTAHGVFVFGTDAELLPLMTSSMTENPGICPRGGHHSVIKYSTGEIRVRCSLKEGRGSVLKPPGK